MGQATEAARRAAQFLALLLAVLIGSLSFAQQDDRAPRPTIANANLGLSLGRVEAPADLRLDEAGDRRVDGNDGWGDDPAHAPASGIARFASPSDRLVALAAAELFAGRAPGGYRARAPPRL